MYRIERMCKNRNVLGLDHKLCRPRTWLTTRQCFYTGICFQGSHNEHFLNLEIKWMAHFSRPWWSQRLLYKHCRKSFGYNGIMQFKGFELETCLKDTRRYFGFGWGFFFAIQAKKYAIFEYFRTFLIFNSPLSNFK